MKKINLSLVSIIVSLLFIAAIVAVIFVSFDQKELTERQTELVRDSVVNCVVQCYALEGRYPDDLKYLQQNYGLQLDTDRYIYHYDKFASNILPDVQVFARPGE